MDPWTSAATYECAALSVRSYGLRPRKLYTSVSVTPRIIKIFEGRPRPRWEDNIRKYIKQIDEEVVSFGSG